MPDRLPLHDLHERLGARFTDEDGLLVPRDYGDVGAEHEAVRERAGLIDRSERSPGRTGRRSSMGSYRTT
jgi:glycine cleavage system aminomethyltransferase T